MKTLTILLSAATAFVSVPTQAAPGNNGGGNGGCGVGQATNGCGGTVTPTTAPPIMVGGAGGTASVGPISNSAQGGAGGSASTGPISNNAQGGSSFASGGNAVNGPNTNVNSNANNPTGIGYGGAGGAGGNASTGPITTTLENTNTSAANATQSQSVGPLTNTVESTNANAANANQAQSTSNANNTSVTFEGARLPASTAVAPTIFSGSDTCMGSSSAGGQGMAFGFSFGTSWTDKNCVRLKNSRHLLELGFDAAAIHIMCQDKSVRRAMRDAGTPCRGGE